jgi:hypothetical protein
MVQEPKLLSESLEFCRYEVSIPMCRDTDLNYGAFICGSIYSAPKNAATSGSVRRVLQAGPSAWSVLSEAIDCVSTSPTCRHKLNRSSVLYFRVSRTCSQNHG